MTSDTITSYLRTGVPAVWGLFITWLMSQLGWLAGLFDAMGWDPTSKQTGAVVTSIFFFIWYAFWRWLEGRNVLPDWLRRLVLGSASAPSYTPEHAAE
jgi:hypothetical protein